MLHTCWHQIDSPVGALLLVGTAAALERIHFQRAGGLAPDRDWTHAPATFSAAVRQLEEYFDGKRSRFELALALTGTPFQRRVWESLRAIPYGRTISYSELARRIGQPRATRAVGLANGANPIPIVIPCHRVLAKAGLGGYSGRGGLATKQTLLSLEAALA